MTKEDMLTHSIEVGMDRQRIENVVQLIHEDVDAVRYDGAEIIVSRKGAIVLHDAIGYADRASGRLACKGDVYPIMSLSKPLSAILLFMRMERGEISLITPIADIIPEYGVLGKAYVTVGEVLAHTAGLPTSPPVQPEQIGDLELCVRALCNSPLQRPAGTSVSYSGWASHYLIGEVVRRLDGGKRPLRKIIEEDLFQPLGMTDTSLGLRPDLRSKKVPLVRRSTKPGSYTLERLRQLEAVLEREDCEIPSAGCYSTATDYHRFARMIASGGASHSERFLSPMTIRLATTNQTGQMVNEFWGGLRTENGWSPWPANIGFGFVVRGEGVFPTNLGILNSPDAYGHSGAGSMAFWTNPGLDLTFVMLTAGWLDEKASLLRFQRISDAVIASVVDL